MECVICGRQLPEGTEVCPYCGTRFSLPSEPERLADEPPKKKIPAVLWRCAALILLLAAGVFLVCRMVISAGRPQMEETIPAEQTQLPTETEPHSHSFAEKSRTEATCEDAGLVEYLCACGQTRQSTLSPLGHRYVGGDCEQGGTCSVCGKTAETGLGHRVQDGVCARCGVLRITLEDLRGTWRKQVLDGYISVTISGSSATVYESYLNGLTWYGTVELTEDGFLISGVYTYEDGAGNSGTNGIRLHCPVEKLTENTLVEAPLGDVWKKQK